MLHIQNTLSGKKELFTPIHPGKVNMYVCGMTVYDYCHIGHARVLVVFDVITRYLRKIYGADNVTYVRNITDIDDKIIARAIENGEDINTLTNRFIAAMHEDADALGVKCPDIEPRATEHMDEILQMIQILIDKGLAYQGDNGDVYYQVSKFSTYGQLAKRNLDDLQSGSRVEVEQSKRDPMDFVLWKMAKEGEPSWDSNWGKGRPGWHIECSAMSTNCLGDHFDIHGGGLDLKFPHHENEIAQSEGCTGHKFVNYWIHNGFVRVDDEKMSKSLGNFFIIREVLQSYAPEVIRYFILSSHYMSPLNYSDENLDKAKASLTTLYQALLDIDSVDENADDSALDEQSDYTKRFEQAMDDDFNTPMAIAVLFDMSHELNRLKSTDVQQAGVLAAQLKRLAELLGLLENNAQQFLQGSCSEGGLADDEINALIEQRATAKQEKNWSECDRIRDVLDAEDILLEDTAEGTRWRRK
ncbi:MAG: cysteine--tRNA ligase [gamma proteobacterium symbiont of Lucinoma myriamae]|nr:cysteine--tRNA ligase [gamma proteobacterium symbiont of Lucinoma myriamae]MCU7819938.1 cysteine--tRNA ligase [gamma proteobacterium symbiont of Lucinoma myriamae]MCU7832343.1 cysteine--tRNA ligase [gamma proteobacterium symbiont of Lucinoma myriamae]